MSKNYHAFLLRIWQVDDPENPAWLSSLEDPHTRKIVGFNSLGHLYEFLCKLTSDPAEYASQGTLPPPGKTNQDG
jgi:hypothetical protein